MILLGYLRIFGVNKEGRQEDRIRTNMVQNKKMKAFLRRSKKAFGERRVGRDREFLAVSFTIC